MKDLEKQKRQLYEMQLHDRLEFQGNPTMEVLNVPGGWIYTQWFQDGESGQWQYTSTFVPYVKA